MSTTVVVSGITATPIVVEAADSYEVFAGVVTYIPEPRAFLSVADQAERDALPSTMLENGKLVYQVDAGIIYKYDEGTESFVSTSITVSGLAATVLSATALTAERGTINDYLQFDITPPTTVLPQGSVAFDAEHQTLAVGMGGGVHLQVGQEQYIRCKNDEGTQINNGQIVFISGASGSNPQAQLASASNYLEAVCVIAMATQDIPDNQFGFFTIIGLVHDVNTTGIPEGALLYLGEDGAFLAAPPGYPSERIVVGICMYEHSSHGIVYFRSIYIPRKFGDIVAGNYTGFDDGGHQRMYGNARPFRDELGDALSLRSVGPGVSANPTEATVDFVVTSDLNDYLYKNLQLNHDRDEDTNIFPHIHFLQASGVMPNFLLQYRWHPNGGAKTTAWTNLRCNVPAFPYSSGTIHQIGGTVSGIAPPANSTISDIVQFRILRDNANASGAFSGADPYAATVGMLSFDVHIQTNSIGSDEQYVK